MLLLASYYTSPTRVECNIEWARYVLLKFMMINCSSDSWGTVARKESLWVIVNIFHHEPWQEKRKIPIFIIEISLAVDPSIIVVFGS